MGATLGIVGLLTGGLTLMETFFGVTVFGLGVDFAVHLFVRFREEREKWSGAEEAVAATLRGTGRGVVAGAVTTAGAFLIVALAPDPVAVHLGLSGGIGLLLCLVLMLLLLPAVWGLTERDWAANGTASGGGKADPRRTKRAAGLLRSQARFERLSLLAVRHPSATLAGTFLLVALSLLALLRFEFETDVSKVLNRKVDSLVAVQRIQELYELNGAPWIVTAPNLAEARKLARSFRDSDEFSYATTLADLLPESSAETERRRARLTLLQPRVVALRAFLASLPPGAAASSPLLQPLFAELPQGWSAEDALRQLEQLLAALEAAPTAAAPTLETLPPGVRGRFESSSSEQLVIAYARGSSLDALVAKRQRDAAQQIDPGATSLSVLLETLMLGDRPWIRPVAVGVVLFVVLVLLVDFRRPRMAVLALVPVAVGTAMTVGILCLVGVRFNIMTLTVLPLLCGLGVDDGIHVVHRMLEEGFKRPAHSAAAVGRAVLMTTLTTCSSFAVLLWTDHPGLETMALVMLIGLPCCWLASITTLPALAALLYPLRPVMVGPDETSNDFLR
jgi:predicted RND superfamily exporter protein